MPYTLEEKRDWALEGKARWEAKMALADAKDERAREMHGGLLSFGCSGNQRAAQQVRAAHGAADRAWREATEKLEYYKAKAKGYERRIAERDRTRFERADIAGATHVKIGGGWHKVVRVSAKSVTVETGYSWTDRHALDKVLDMRTVVTDACGTAIFEAGTRGTK